MTQILEVKIGRGLIIVLKLNNSALTNIECISKWTLSLPTHSTGYLYLEPFVGRYNIISLYADA